MTVLVGALLLVVSFVAPAGAIPVTGGSVAIGSGSFGSIDIFGSGFAVDATIFDAPGVLVCQLCLPVPQSLQTSVSVGDFIPGDTAIVDGTTYLFPFLAGVLTFQGTWTPPVPGPSSLSVTVPFTVNGFLTPSATSGTIDLTGSGTATVDLASDGSAYLRQGVRYDFAPVPEPTTVVLAVSALSALLGAHQFRRRRRRPAQDGEALDCVSIGPAEVIQPTS